jgi:[ribosomal protein S18]-alanine N-acetyltransferase
MKRPPAQLRTARASDLDAIVALERETGFAPHWPAAAYAAILDPASPQRCLIVAEADAKLAGFAVGLMHPVAAGSPERVAELESVAVASNSRRAGIGRALCMAVIEWCREQGATEMVLEVRVSSAGAIALYAALGFTQMGRRPRYYRDPEDDAVVMRLVLV